MSSLFADAYLVPGPIDTTVPINPITAGVSPFNPDVNDPHDNIVAQGAFAAGFHTVLVDRLPERNWSNSRWGRTTHGVLLRDYTVQAWFFRTFNQAPSPVITNASAFGLTQQGMTTFIDERGRKCNPATASGVCTKKAPVVTLLDRHLESVVGIASTWFSQPVNGILKWEIEYFIDELAVIPEKNLNPRVQIPRALRADNEKDLKNSIPTADYIRWVIGYDRNFFVRELNPTNSFILVASYNSSFNLSEKGGRDYRNAKRQARTSPDPTRADPGEPGMSGRAGTHERALRASRSARLRGRVSVRGLPPNDRADRLHARQAEPSHHRHFRHQRHLRLRPEPDVPYHRQRARERHVPRDRVDGSEGGHRDVPRTRHAAATA
jgi:hypothetical protein